MPLLNIIVIFTNYIIIWKKLGLSLPKTEIEPLRPLLANKQSVHYLKGAKKIPIKVSLGLQCNHQAQL
jgi:hypothetical protein